VEVVEVVEVIKVRSFKIIVAIMISLCLLASPAWAGLRVSSFSCTPDDVFIGMPVSCQATIKNTDTQNSVSLSTVKLLLDTPWAGGTTTFNGMSYSPSQTLQAGGSVVVTFEDIIPTVAGIQGFAENGLTSSPPIEDYDPSGVSVNVVDPQQHLSGDISVTEAAEGEYFAAGITLASQSSLKDVVLELAITSGSCSLVSNSQKTIPSISAGAPVAVSWKLEQGSDTCQFKIELLNASSGTASVFGGSANAISGSVGTGGGGGGTGGAGGGGGGATGDVVTVKKVEPGVGAIFDFSQTGVKDIMSQIELFAKETTYNVEIKAKLVEGKPYATMPDPVGSAYQYLQITASNIAATTIEKADVSFKVPISYLKENDIHPASVVLSRDAQSKWNVLTTEKIGSDGTYIYYSAETPGFSYFVISASDGSGYVEEEITAISEAVSPTTIPEETEGVVNEAPLVKDVMDKLPTVEVPEDEGGVSKLVVVLLVFVAIGGAVVVLHKRGMIDFDRITGKASRDLEGEFLGLYRKYQEQGGKPTYGEIAEELGISLEKVDEIVAALKDKLNE
jgi:PGF-pre-PGF domain-containing protein